MVKSKSSMSAAQREMLAHVNAYIEETQPVVDSVIDRVKDALWKDYGDTPYTTESDKALIRAALDEYEPSVTEAVIADIVYGGNNYGEVMIDLGEALEGTKWSNDNDFYMEWAALKRMTDEKERLIAGQLVMGLK